MKKLILFIFLFLIFGCASRKVSIDKSYIKKDSISQIDIKTISNSQIETKIVNDILIDEIIIKPLDTTKEIVINGVKYKNVVLTYKKTKDNSLHINNKTIQLSEHKQQKMIVSVNKKEVKKQIDKKVNYFGYLWFLLIPVLYFIYTYLKKKMFKI